MIQHTPRHRALAQHAAGLGLHGRDGHLVQPLDPGLGDGDLVARQSGFALHHHLDLHHRELEFGTERDGDRRE